MIVSAMEFRPIQSIRISHLAAICNEQTVCIWEVHRNSNNKLKTSLCMPMEIQDLSWSNDGTYIYLASQQKKLLRLDVRGTVLASIDAHDGPVTTCNFLTAPGYEGCVLTGSSDRTIKLWDVRRCAPVYTFNLPNKVSCSDVDGTMAVFCTDIGNVYVFKLGRTFEMVRSLVPPFQSERRCVAIFRDRATGEPAGFSLGTTEGRVINIYNDIPDHESLWLYNHNQSNMTMTPVGRAATAVNDIKFHPIHGTLAIARNNGYYSFYNTMEPQAQLLKVSKNLNRPIEKCCFNKSGTIFAYSTGYSLSNDQTIGPSISFNHLCYDQMNPDVIVVYC